MWTVVGVICNEISTRGRKRRHEITKTRKHIGKCHVSVVFSWRLFGSTFYGTSRQAGDEVPLQEHERRHHRDQADEARGGDELPFGFVRALQAEDAERDGEARLRIEQHERKRELGPVGG